MRNTATTKPANSASWLEIPCTDLPPGIGFIAHIRDVAGNRVGLHALA